MGIILIYHQASQPDSTLWSFFTLDFNHLFFTISLSLDILFTLMIFVQIRLRARDTRNGKGVSSEAARWYLTVLFNSSTLYAVTFLLFIGSWGARSHDADIFFPVLVEIQVRAVSTFH